MVFNSIPFVVFFVLFFFVYWVVWSKSVKAQNLLILLGSYIFYAWWDWRFLFLLIGTSVLNYFLGIGIYKSSNERYRAFLLWIGLLQGLGSLVFFKYFNFFINILVCVFGMLNIKPAMHTLNIMLPLGISFYTFRTISYLLDIKKGRVTPTTNWVVFLSYVSFFPSLVSGPIDRPKNLMPQLENKRVFDYSQAADGMRQILWGLFKKVVIADNCAVFTTNVFNHYQTLPASSLLLGAFLVTIQLYADFSGYSDIAIGVAKLIGFNITRNFNYPFFAQDIADFWRRWHISLTSWFTDYLFKPLAMYFRGSKNTGIIIAILINFIAIGIWHGANWTFILFGFLNGCLYIPLILRGELGTKKNQGSNINTPSLSMFLNMAATFILVMFTIIIFRSDSVSQAFDYYGRLFSSTLFSKPPIEEKVNIVVTLLAIILMFAAEWFQQAREYALQIDFIKPFMLRVAIYYGLVFLILTFSATKMADFVYLKF